VILIDLCLHQLPSINSIQFTMDHCLPAVEKLIQALKAHHTRDAGECCAYELEARLGYINPTDSTFKPGVSSDKFDAILTAFTVCSSWHSVTDFRESWDVFYKTPDNRILRTTTTGEHVEHCEKTKLDNVSMCASGCKVNATGDAVDIRVALARERLVLSKDVPHNVEPQLVRVKQRKSFHWGAWRWDLSRIWEGATLLEVDAHRASHAPRYEVEVELAKAEQYLSGQSVGHAAASLLLKLRDIVYPLADDPTLEYFPPEHFMQ
jgi:hypothetical protein